MSRSVGTVGGMALLAGLLAVASAQAANISWTNSDGGSWSSAGNWSPRQVPQATDHVYITNRGTYTVTMDVDATVASLNLGGASGVQTFDLDYPNTLTLNGAGRSQTTNGVFQLTGGTLAGAGNLVLAGPFETTGGSITGTGVLQLNGFSRFLGPSVVNLYTRTLVNNGILTYSGGSLYTGNGSVISNLAGAIFDLAGDVGTSFRGSDPAGMFYNAGLLRKSVDESYQSEIDEVFSNNGVIQVQAGRLALLRNSVNNGSNGVWAGAALSFSGDVTNQHTLGAGSLVTGPGDVLFDQGTVDVLGTYTVSGTNLIGGATASFKHGPGLALNRLQVVWLGTVNFLTGSEVTINALDMLDGGTVAGSDDLTLTGPLLWNSGWITGSGRVQCNGGVTIDTEGDKGLSGRTLVNGAALTWTNGYLVTGHGSVISNQLDATFIMGAPANTLFSGFGSEPVGTVLNAGLMRKLAGGGTATFDDVLINAGTLEVQAGTLRCERSVMQTDGQTLLSGGRLEVADPLALEGGLLTGSGTLAGSVTNHAVVSPGASVGTITITGDYAQGAGAVLRIDLGGLTPGTGFDRLVVQGSASLNGKVSASLVNGFMPLSNAVFSFFSGPRSGTFSSFTHPTFLGMNVEYAANGASMRVTNIAPTPLLQPLTEVWRYVTNDILHNDIWELEPRLTFPAMAGAEYRLFHTTNVASGNWTAWPDSGPPFFFPTYVTATGSTMTILGPSVGLRVIRPLPPSVSQSVEPAHFYRIEFKP
jgi:fibronectin-binding autotransporter adhesin